ncbi:MAG: hypothetical protein B7X00_00835 [Legionella sp. 21-45-4]|nr:MAG: hypothetical protein B7X00_00835 [Legionella sp. 21-45-4]
MNHHRPDLFEAQETEEALLHRRRTRRLLEERFERKRLEQELDYFSFMDEDESLDDEFDWNDASK